MMKRVPLFDYLMTRCVSLKLGMAKLIVQDFLTRVDLRMDNVENGLIQADRFI